MPKINLLNSCQLHFLAFLAGLFTLAGLFFLILVASFFLDVSFVGTAWQDSTWFTICNCRLLSLGGVWGWGLVGVAYSVSKGGTFRTSSPDASSAATDLPLLAVAPRLAAVDLARVAVAASSATAAAIYLLPVELLWLLFLQLIWLLLPLSLVKIVHLCPHLSWPFLVCQILVLKSSLS